MLIFSFLLLAEAQGEYFIHAGILCLGSAARFKVDELGTECFYAGEALPLLLLPAVDAGLFGLGIVTIA